MPSSGHRSLAPGVLGRTHQSGWPTHCGKGGPLRRPKRVAQGGHGAVDIQSSVELLIHVRICFLALGVCLAVPKIPLFPLTVHPQVSVLMSLKSEMAEEDFAEGDLIRRIHKKRSAVRASAAPPPKPKPNDNPYPDPSHHPPKSGKKEGPGELMAFFEYLLFGDGRDAKPTHLTADQMRRAEEMWIKDQERQRLTCTVFCR